MQGGEKGGLSMKTQNQCKVSVLCSEKAGPAQLTVVPGAGGLGAALESASVASQDPRESADAALLWVVLIKPRRGAVDTQEAPGSVPGSSRSLPGAPMLMLSGGAPLPADAGGALWLSLRMGPALQGGGRVGREGSREDRPCSMGSRADSKCPEGGRRAKAWMTQAGDAPGR